MTMVSLTSQEERFCFLWHIPAGAVPVQGFEPIRFLQRRILSLTRPKAGRMTGRSCRERVCLRDTTCGADKNPQGLRCWDSNRKCFRREQFRVSWFFTSRLRLESMPITVRKERIEMHTDTHFYSREVPLSPGCERFAATTKYA